jgi:hypothetical protein
MKRKPFSEAGYSRDYMRCELKQFVTRVAKPCELRAWLSSRCDG